MKNNTNKDYIAEVISKLESFDSFFAGLSMKDEKNAVKLYEQYVVSFLKKALLQASKKEKEKTATRIKTILTDPDNYLRGQLLDYLKEL